MSGKGLRLALGAVAGLSGTLAIHGVRTASQRWLPSTVGPVRRDPGEFMVEKAEAALPERTVERIPESVESTVSQSLHFAYGMTPGVLYAALRPAGGNTLIEGALLGLAVWAAGYLGWLPATGLMPPVTEQEPKQVVGPMVRHALYGIATVTAYQQLRRLAR